MAKFMDKNAVIAAAGYPSIDRIIRIKGRAQVGKTSAILNDDHDRITYGGCNVNICCILAGLGVAAMPMMTVGADFASSGYQAFLARENLLPDGITESRAAATSSSYLIEDENGDHITLFYEGAMNEKHYIFPADEGIRRADMGVITVGNADYNFRFFDTLKAQGKPVALSLKLDEKAFPEAHLRTYLSESDYIFMNETESKHVCALYGCRGAEALFGAHTQCIAVTRGAAGSVIYYREGDKVLSAAVEAAMPERINDHAGAGDAFVAGFLFGLLNGHTCVECGGYGSVCASYILEEKGCLSGMPDVGQIEKRYITTYR